MLQIILALMAGILTIAAPCILLPLPIVLGGSVGQNSKTRPLFITLGFVVSFASVALLVNFLVQSLDFDPNALRTGAVILLIIFAIFMIWPTPFEKLMAHLSGLLGMASQSSQTAGNGNWGGLILGMIIGVIWAPCAGPILGAILTLVALQNDFGQASLLLVAYAIGAGLPMLAIAYGGQVLTTRVKGIAKYSARLQQIFGVILILLAGAIYFQYDTIIQTNLVKNFPTLGTGLENNLMNIFKNNNPTADQANLENLGPAPEFAGISHWLNSEPLTMKDLRGKVVLIDFWTYSCINCIRTLPYVTKWYDTYHDQGLVVIGVHSPEFAFEKETANVQTAIDQYKIKYLVAQDNELGTWLAYNNQYWPAEYLIDQKGNIVYTHFGESEYDVTENAIRKLLGMKTDAPTDNGPDLGGIRSPEMYFGTDRDEYLTPAQRPSETPQNYTLSDSLALNQFAVEGNWQFLRDKATLVKGAGKIKLHFSSGKLFMVAQSLSQPVILSITVDGKRQLDVTVSQSQLYTLFDSNNYTDHAIEIDIPSPGFDAFTFTFG